MNGGLAHRSATTVLSVLMAVIGLALLVEGLSAGAAWGRLLLGVLFLAAGAGRLYLLSRRREES
jgi:hypothetical protein